MLETVIHQLFILGMLCLTGFVAERFGILPDSIQKGLSSLVLEVTLPASIIAGADISLGSSGNTMILHVVIIAAVYYGVTLFLSVKGAGFLFKDKTKGKLAALSVSFANVAFMGFPVSYALYGNEGLFFASIFSVFYNIYLFTIGINLLKPGSRGSIVRVMFNTRNIAILIMLSLFLFKISLPEVLQDTFSIMGDASTPLSMFIIGAMLSRSSWKNLLVDRSVYGINAVRLVLIPLLMIFIFRITGYSNILVIRVMIVMASMPVGSLIAMLAERYECEPEYATITIVQSMFLFIITFPLMMLLTEIAFPA